MPVIYSPFHSHGIPDSYCSKFQSFDECCKAMQLQFNASSDICNSASLFSDSTMIILLGIIILLVVMAVIINILAKGDNS